MDKFTTTHWYKTIATRNKIYMLRYLLKILSELFCIATTVLLDELINDK